MGKQKHISNEDEQPKPKIGLLKEETLNYYRRVSESLDSGFDNDEDKCLFVNNVVTQLSEETISVSQNQTASRIVEVLVNVCNKDQALVLFTAFSKDWYTACTDRFASHVCQKLMIKGSGFLTQSGALPPKDKSHSRELTHEETQDTDDPKSLEDLFLGLCDFIEGDLDELLCHTYGSHIIRVLLEVLGGVSVEEKLVRSKLSREQTRGQSAIFKPGSVLESFHCRLLTLSEKIMNIENFEGYLVETLPTTVIQTVLLVLKQKNDDLCQKYCGQILQVSGFLEASAGEESDDKSLPALVQSTSGSYLVEQLLALSSKDVHQDIMSKVFLGRCIQFAVDSQANFVLQRLLTTITDPDQLKPVFKELYKNFEDILAIQHVGVLSKVAEACLKLNSLQVKFSKALQRAFHCYKPAERRKAIISLLASLSTYEILYPATPENSDEEADTEKPKASDKKVLFSKVNLHGSLIVQHMLKFDPPTTAVDSLISLTSVELLELTSNPCGSHIVDAFFKSPTVHQNSKQHMIHKLKGSYMDLACNKNGSRALQTIWDCSSLKQKIIIAEELSKQEPKLQSDKFGHFAHRNFALHHFIHRRNDWKELQGVKAKKRKMFEDIFQDSVSNSKKKGKKAGGTHDESHLFLDQERMEDGFDIGDMFKKKSYPARGRDHGRGGGRGRGSNRGRGGRGGVKGFHGGRDQGFSRGRGRGRGKSPGRGFNKQK